MTRAERRRAEKSTGKKAIYNLTEEQLELMFRERMDKEFARVKQAAVDEATTEFLTLMFALPMDVLMEDFWPKSYDKKIPKFTKKLLDKYATWQNGDIDMEKLKEKLWELAGVRLVVED